MNYSKLATSILKLVSEKKKPKMCYQYTDTDCYYMYPSLAVRINRRNNLLNFKDQNIYQNMQSTSRIENMFMSVNAGSGYQLLKTGDIKTRTMTGDMCYCFKTHSDDDVYCLKKSLDIICNDNECYYFRTSLPNGKSNIQVYNASDELIALVLPVQL